MEDLNTCDEDVNIESITKSKMKTVSTKQVTTFLKLNLSPFPKPQQKDVIIDIKDKFPPLPPTKSPTKSPLKTPIKHMKTFNFYKELAEEPSTEGSRGILQNDTSNSSPISQVETSNKTDLLSVRLEKSNVDFECNFCRFCHKIEETKDDKLISPCKCNGSSKYTHQSCLTKWIKSKKMNIDFVGCEVCGNSFNIVLKKKIDINKEAYRKLLFKYLGISISFCFFVLTIILVGAFKSNLLQKIECATAIVPFAFVLFVGFTVIIFGFTLYYTNKYKNLYQKEIEFYDVPLVDNDKDFQIIRNVRIAKK